MCTKMMGPLFGSLGLATLLICTSAQGAHGPARASEEGRRACTPDVFRLCSEFIPDASQITTCLQQRVRILSPECRSVFTSPARQ